MSVSKRDPAAVRTALPEGGRGAAAADLHGLSTKDLVPALAEFFGSQAGLSAAAITWFTESWKAEREAFMSRDLSDVDYVYVWVDGVHFNVRLGEDDRLCVLVMVGVRTDGTNELSCTGSSPPTPRSPKR